MLNVLCSKTSPERYPPPYPSTARRGHLRPHWGRIALLAIAQRTVRAYRAHIPLNRRSRRHIPTAINTPGDYLHAKRYEKGLHRYQIAKKMRITGSLVLVWERGESEPDAMQWDMLGRILCFDAQADLPKPHR